MGLDAVELVMEVEETFGIRISDDEAVSLRTVGQLYDMVQMQCTKDRSSACLTSAAFYQVRQGLCNTLHKDKRDVRPKTPIDDLIVPLNSHSVWSQFRSELCFLRLPSLCRPRWFSITLEHPFGFAFITLVAIFFAFIAAPAILYMWILPLLALEAILLLALLTMGDEIAPSLPRDFQTVGDLSRIVLKKNQIWFEARQRTWESNRVWTTLQKLISEQLGVDVAKVTRDARLVDDLGV